MGAGSGEKMSRLQFVPVQDCDNDSCMTFVFTGETHTLGNALRYVVAKNPQVTFCGYSVPHPSERKINFRIQTNGVSAIDVLRKGLEDLQTLCDHVLDTFQGCVEEFKEQFPDGRRMTGVPGEDDS